MIKAPIWSPDDHSAPSIKSRPSEPRRRGRFALFFGAEAVWQHLDASQQARANPGMASPRDGAVLSLPVAVKPGRNHKGRRRADDRPRCAADPHANRIGVIVRIGRNACPHKAPHETGPPPETLARLNSPRARRLALPPVVGPEQVPSRTRAIGGPPRPRPNLPGRRWRSVSASCPGGCRLPAPAVAGVPTRNRCQCRPARHERHRCACRVAGAWARCRWWPARHEWHRCACRVAGAWARCRWRPARHEWHRCPRRTGGAWTRVSVAVRPTRRALVPAPHESPPVPGGWRVGTVSVAARTARVALAARAGW